MTAQHTGFLTSGIALTQMQNIATFAQTWTYFVYILCMCHDSWFNASSRPRGSKESYIVDIKQVDIKFSASAFRSRPMTKGSNKLKWKCMTASPHYCARQWDSLKTTWIRKTNEWAVWIIDFEVIQLLWSKVGTNFSNLPPYISNFELIILLSWTKIRKVSSKGSGTLH